VAHASEIIETVEPRMPSRPKHVVPAMAWDTHAHVFGPYDRFPFAEPSRYPPPNAPTERHQQMLASVGIELGVLVQPAPYAADASAIVNAARASKGRVRGVASATANVSDDTLSRLDREGIRGLRFVEMRSGGQRYPGSIGADQLGDLAPRVRNLGWHAEFWAMCDDYPVLLPEATKHGIPVVLEHMASPRLEAGVCDPSFQSVLRFLSEGKIWVKLTVCRNSNRGPDYSDLRPFHDALVAANPERLLWGSDWPFVRMGDSAPDVGALLDLLFEWVPDHAIRERILVHNPRDLYNFRTRGDDGDNI
jgi:2-pyrone-4,6-dicarboxylate lactonase